MPFTDRDVVRACVLIIVTTKAGPHVQMQTLVSFGREYSGFVCGLLAISTGVFNSIPVLYQRDYP